MIHQQIEVVRQTPGASILLFITDRCPVACEHCSVNSAANSAMISDFPLFIRLLKGVTQRPGIQVVGISGGEPFAERRGLIEACDRLTECGKSIVVYTSGVWASSKTRTSGRPPAWIRSVLKQCCTVYLSTDSFHQARASKESFMHAARHIAEAGAWIVVQTLELEQTAQLLHETFGSDYGDFAELVELTPLRNGRGSHVFPVLKTQPASNMGTCSLAVTPVLRYDGWVTACCNEEIIMGKGPERFRTRVQRQDQLAATLDTYLADPLMRCIARVGLGNLTEHPDLRHLTRQRYVNTCDLCWKISSQYPSRAPSDRLIRALAKLGEIS